MSNKFQPTFVDTLESLLNFLIKEEDNFDHKKKYAIKKNIVYSLQYLEYLAFTLSEKDNAKLTSVIKIMTIRSFIITGMGVIEGILYYIIVTKNLHKKRKEELIADNIKAQFNTLKNIKKGSDTKYYIKSQIFRVLDISEQDEEEMSLDYLIKKVESHNILGEDREIYKKLNYLRKLRNTVHIHLIEERLDTHYNKFANKEFEMMKTILYHLLCTIGIVNDSQVAEQAFSYLIPKKDAEINSFEKLSNQQ